MSVNGDKINVINTTLGKYNSTLSDCIGRLAGTHEHTKLTVIKIEELINSLGARN